MHRVMYTNAFQYVSNRGGIFYYVRRVPNDVRQFYASSRISFSLRTKSQRSAARVEDNSPLLLDAVEMYLTITGPVPTATSHALANTCFKRPRPNPRRTAARTRCPTIRFDLSCDSVMPIRPPFDDNPAPRRSRASLSKTCLYCLHPIASHKNTKICNSTRH
jgi:hypothetical protein